MSIACNVRELFRAALYIMYTHQGPTNAGACVAAAPPPPFEEDSMGVSRNFVKGEPNVKNYPKMPKILTFSKRRRVARLPCFHVPPLPLEKK